MVQLNNPAPLFRSMALANDEFKEISLEDYEGKFVVLFFYGFGVKICVVVGFLFGVGMLGVKVYEVCEVVCCGV